MRLLFAGGGTAGHINPALALANYFSAKDGAEIRFVGTKEGLETSLVPDAGYPLDFIRVHGFRRSLTWENLKNLAELPFAVSAADKIIRNFCPDAVIGTGGYVCGPVLYAAAKRGIPTMVHESNAFPGITTKLLSSYVDTVALGVEDASFYLPKAKHILVTGTPIRPSLLEGNEFEARRMLKLDSRPFIVCFGGSLGARDFNRTLVDWICKTAKKETYQIMMGTGKLHQFEEVKKRFQEHGVDMDTLSNVTVCEYIYDMNIVMQAADIVVSRAGASTLCELTALGKPSVLVPSPYVTDNHQEHNARALERGGAAKVIVESDFTPERLEKTLAAMTAQKETLVSMKRSAIAMGHTDATQQLYRETKRLMGIE
ncbi:MAG: undecaprenyldiphospho-muramoylpentapeptide beta-N-acetylglucosaminyltransferase [Clostridia bacterium]|nr:undecaprenyldiphospho-muramoylpentapeptide beta-N-acetylglucosaminyltransferase [Clostridia bacterium]